MGRQELDDALAALRSAASAQEVVGLFPAVHLALADMQRKRGLFLETAFGCVRRAIWSLLRGASAGEGEGGDNEDGGDLRGSLAAGGLALAQAVSLTLDFVEPLVRHAPGSPAVGSRADNTRERGVLVAMGLYLLGVFGDGSVFSARHQHLRSRLVAAVGAGGIDTHVLLATMRFREELSTCRRALLPTFESDSESDSEEERAFSTGEDDEGEGDDDVDMRRDDMQWVAQRAAKAWGLSEYVYFLNDSGQEFAFAAWSTRGIGIFAYSVFVEKMPVDSKSAPSLAPIISPLSAIFLVAAYAHAMIVDDELEVRARGLKLLQVFLARCPERQLPCTVDTNASTTKAAPFHHLEARFHARNWVDVIIQAMTSAMVSFPDATDRSNALAVLRTLISIIDVNDRFWLLKELALKCPYANVSAVLVDTVRADAVMVWRSEDSMASDSPHTSSAIVEFVSGVLAQAAERDLVLHSDLIASCLSLYRFLHIRDKENRTGIRDRDVATLAVFSRIQRRLHQRQNEDVPMEQTADHHDHGLTDPGASTHLFLLEAALSSTLSLNEPNSSG